MRLINPVKGIFFIIGIIRGFAVVNIILKKHPEVSLVLNENSFGHTITILDILSRGYYPHDINVLVNETDAFNVYLKEIFSENINYISYLSLAKRLKFNNNYQIIEGVGVSFCAGVVASLKPGSQHILHGSLLYRFYNTSKTIPKFYSENKRKLIGFNTFINHSDLISITAGINRKLYKTTLSTVYDKIKKMGGDRSYLGIISILLRKQKNNYGLLHDKLRDSGDEGRYVYIAKYFSNKGYLILITGEASYDLFSTINNTLNCNDIGVTSQLLNIFCLSESSLVICQHSGPVHLANSSKVPLVISDALPLWQGSANKNDLIVHKRFLENKKSEYLSYTEIKEKYNGLFYGEYSLLSFHDLRIADSDKRDIIDASNEILESKKTIKLGNEEQYLIESYFSTIPSDTLAYIRKTRPPMSVLKREFKD